MDQKEGEISQMPKKRLLLIAQKTGPGGRLRQAAMPMLHLLMTNEKITGTVICGLPLIRIFLQS